MCDGPGPARSPQCNPGQVSRAWGPGFAICRMKGWNQVLSSCAVMGPFQLWHLPVLCFRLSGTGARRSRDPSECGSSGSQVTASPVGLIFQLEVISPVPPEKRRCCRPGSRLSHPSRRSTPGAVRRLRLCAEPHRMGFPGLCLSDSSGCVNL